MADNPTTDLLFRDGCPDCAERQVNLPGALPESGDDFDWLVRDYDGFRLFMLQELAARFPERTRWTPADVEVALVEVLAFVLDQFSDTLDRISAESFLTTARRPETVRRLLSLIGYDALGIAQQLNTAPFDKAAKAGDTRTDAQRFDQYWLDNPHKMDAVRRDGIRSVHKQRRMVTLDDYVNRLEEHPLVSRATAWEDWTGSWTSVRIALICEYGYTLDQEEINYSEFKEEIDDFHAEGEIKAVSWPDAADPQPTIRTLLRMVVDNWRMIGQEVVLQDAVPVGIMFSLSIKVAENYFQSEVRQAIEGALNTDADGFFEPGRLRFGEDLHASDLFETVMALDGVENVCLNRFKRVGSQYADQSDAGLIELNQLEIAVCDNDAQNSVRGYYYLKLHGGRRG